ncbi:MAG: ester cyclase [Bacteroidetes bacterium]|jgi:steroid delta-isomerase-like uncharacterized protein|nr:ester cyclase [Bacteroidota bacterium]
MDNVKQNKEICKRFFDELHDKGNFDIIDELVHPNVISHDPFPGQPEGSEGVRSTMKIFRTAFPDLKLIHNDMIAEDDRVMIKFTATGTHQAEFMYIPATGNKIAYEEVVILRLKDGKITEHWAVADAMALLQQLGVKNF